MFEQEIYSERWSSRVRSQVDKSMICKVGEDVIRSLLDESRSRFETDQRNGGDTSQGWGGDTDDRKISSAVY